MVTTKINLITLDLLIDEETISLAPEEDYDDYKTRDTSRADETFTEPDATKATSTLKLR